MGYDLTDWWFDSSVNVAIQEVDPSMSRGLGFYRVECAYENEEGESTVEQKYDAHLKHFGEEVE